jgi:hypothetical protein
MCPGGHTVTAVALRGIRAKKKGEVGEGRGYEVMRRRIGRGEKEKERRSGRELEKKR